MGAMDDDDDDDVEQSMITGYLGIKPNEPESTLVQ